MTRRRIAHSRNRSPMLVAAVVCVAFLLLNWHFATMEIDRSPIAPDSDVAGSPFDPAEGPSDGSVGEQKLAFYPQTLARPLFRADRRLPVEPEITNTEPVEQAASPKRSSPLLGDLELVGIMLQGSGGGRALIRAGGVASGTWIEIGHTLDGWRLIEVEPGSIVFESDGEKRRLTLFPSRMAPGQKEEGAQPETD